MQCSVSGWHKATTGIFNPLQSQRHRAKHTGYVQAVERVHDLQGVLDVPIYGRVAVMELFRPPVFPQMLKKHCFGL